MAASHTLSTEFLFLWLENTTHKDYSHRQSSLPLANPKMQRLLQSIPMATKVSFPEIARRPWCAALLSVALPGLGHFYAGNKRRAWWLFAVDVIILGCLLFAYQALRPFLGSLLGGNSQAEVSNIALYLVKGWVSTRGITVYMLVNIAILVFRGWAAYDAAETARGPALIRPGGRGLTIAGGLVFVILLPHAAFAYYGMIQYNFIVTTFQSEDVAAPTTTQAIEDDRITTSSPTSTTVRTPEPALWDGLDRLNILLMGGDAGPGRRAIRTDTMIVVSIDPVTGDAAMLGIPRNWARVPLPNGHGVWDCQCFPRILNDLYYAGEVEYPHAFPGPGTPGENAIKMGMGEFLGIPIHYYALVDLNGFVGIVDALGGVEIDVPVRIVDEQYPHEDGETIEHVVIQQGQQTLDGHSALAYARIRRHADDYARMHRQRCVLEAVIEQSSATELLAAYPRLVGVLNSNLQTDIPASRLDDFIELLTIVDTDEIVALRLIPPDYRDGYNDFGFSTPNVSLVQEHVAIITGNPPEAAIELLDIPTLSDTCS